MWATSEDFYQGFENTFKSEERICFNHMFKPVFYNACHASMHLDTSDVPVFVAIILVDVFRENICVLYWRDKCMRFGAPRSSRATRWNQTQRWTSSAAVRRVSINENLGIVLICMVDFIKVHSVSHASLLLTCDHVHVLIHICVADDSCELRTIPVFQVEKCIVLDSSRMD